MPPVPFRGRPPRVAAALSALAGALAVAGCASNGGGGSDEATGIQMRDPIDHFASNFELDSATGRMVARDGARFDAGTTDAFQQSFDVESLNRQAFDAARFGGGTRFDEAGKAVAKPSSDLLSQRSRMAGRAADEAGSAAPGPGRSRFEGRAADATGAYRGAADRYGTGDFDEATRALNEAAVGNVEDEAEEGDMSIEDVRRLLNKGS